MLRYFEKMIHPCWPSPAWSYQTGGGVVIVIVNTIRGVRPIPFEQPDPSPLVIAPISLDISRKTAHALEDSESKMAGCLGHRSSRERN